MTSSAWTATCSSALSPIPLLLGWEFEAARQVGLAGVAWAERAPIAGRDPGRCLRLPDQGRFHPLKYLDGLARCIRRDSGRLHAGTVVVGVDEEGEEVLARTRPLRALTRLERPFPFGHFLPGGTTCRFFAFIDRLGSSLWPRLAWRASSRSMAACSQAMSAMSACCWPAVATKCSRLALSAVITGPPWKGDCLSVIPSVALGIMRVSVCAPARFYAHQRWTPFLVGASNVGTAPSMFARDSRE